MLQILMDDSEGHRLFSVKVDPGQNGFRLPDYNAIIKKPMDLGTVEKELLNGTLKTPDLFIEGKKQNLKKNSYKLLLLFIFWKLRFSISILSFCLQLLFNQTKSETNIYINFIFCNTCFSFFSFFL